MADQDSEFLDELFFKFKIFFGEKCRFFGILVDKRDDEGEVEAMGVMEVLRVLKMGAMVALAVANKKNRTCLGN